jgi:hypothetical protein
MRLFMREPNWCRLGIMTALFLLIVLAVARHMQVFMRRSIMMTDI